MLKIVVEIVEKVIQLLNYLSVSGEVLLKKMPAKQDAVTCCCKCRMDNNGHTHITERLLYRIAFTVWHVALHLENEQVDHFNFNT